MSHCVHGREVGFGLECWECNAEARRHEEAIAMQHQLLSEQQSMLNELEHHHEQSLQAQVRQEELQREATLSLERAAEIQEQRLVIEKQRISTEEARVRTEQERLELRTGLPEFSGAYRRTWIRLSEVHDALLHREDALRNELFRVAEAVATESAAIQRTRDEIYNDLARSLDTHLKSGAKNFIEPLIFTDPTNRQRLAACSNSLLDLNLRIGADHDNYSAREGTLSELYGRLALFTAKIDSKLPLAQVPIATPGCASLLLLPIIFACFNSIGKGGDFFPLFLFLVASLVVILAIPIHRVLTHRRLEALYHPARNLINSYNALLVDKLPKAGLRAEEKWPVDTDPLGQRTTAVLRNSQIALHNTFTALLQPYIEDNIKLHPNAELLAAKSAVRERSETRAAEIKKRLGRSAEEQALENNFAAFHREIRRVGRLILEGRRLPGTLIELTQCSACSSPMSSEARKCSLCGASTA